MITLKLEGLVPSKKNAWRRGNGGRVYIPEGIQADIDALIVQAQVLKRSLDLKPIAGHHVRVQALFVVQREHKDLDNVFTTVLDVLQKAEIIQNDKLVRSFAVDEQVRSDEDPHVLIKIEPLSTGSYARLSSQREHAS